LQGTVIYIMVIRSDYFSFYNLSKSSLFEEILVMMV
jgi:hypothetical protein